MPPSKKTKKQTINNPPKKVLTVTGNDWDKLLEAEPEETLKENELLVPQIELSREMMSTPDSLDNEDKITVVESNEPDEDAIARAKLLKELKEQRQAKLKISSISYNLKNHKESRLLPYLVKQETHEDSESNSSPFPSKPIFISLHVPQTFKIPTIKKPQTTPKRNVFQEPSYMRSTMCYSRRRWDAEMIFEQEEEQNSVSKSIEFNGLDSISKPTQTFLQKIKSPKKIDLDSKLVWRPNTQYEPDYIPSINNARYTAKPETHSKISTATHSPTVRATSYSTDMHTFTSPGLNSPPEYKIVHPFSLTFQGALPELSSFITQYSPRSQSKNKYLM